MDIFGILISVDLIIGLGCLYYSFYLQQTLIEKQAKRIINLEAEIAVKTISKVGKVNL